MGKIIQLIPTSDWIAEYEIDNGTIEECLIAFIALNDDGEIIFIDLDEDGVWYAATENEYFKRLKRVKNV